VTGHRRTKSINIINNDKIPIEFIVQDESNEISASGWKLDITPSQAMILPGQKAKLDVSVESSYG
jgi:hypothetical protein